MMGAQLRALAFPSCSHMFRGVYPFAIVECWKSGVARVVFGTGSWVGVTRRMDTRRIWTGRSDVWRYGELEMSRCLWCGVASLGSYDDAWDTWHASCFEGT